VISIDDFCDEHRACKDGREWAIANCSDMPDAWEKLRPDWLIWIATRPGVLTDRELRLFAVFCARQVEHLLTDQRSIDAISMAEKFAKGEATTGELTAAWAAAWAAADAAWAAAWAAADAAWAAAGAATRDAANAAWAAAWDAQSDWLRENTKPNFGVEVTS
jgi:hypothetical protein